MMEVFGYVRVSLSVQAKEGFSLAAQRQAITKFCHRKRFHLRELFADEGVSGTDAKIGERKGLLTMLARIGEVKAVVVVNTSRLWRDDLAKALIKRELLQNGVEVVSLDQSTYRLNSTDPSEFLVNGMLELLDQFVKMQLVMTMELGRQEKLANGGFPGGGVPLGYDTKDGELVVSDAERRIVDLVVSLRKKGCGFRQIATRLNERGVKGKRGGRFHKRTIRRIVANETYLGRIRYGKKSVRGNHTPLVSAVSFARANAPQNDQDGSFSSSVLD